MEKRIDEYGDSFKSKTGNMSLSVICPVCQNLCSKKAASCPQCGHPLNTFERASPPANKINSNRKWMIPAILVGILALVLVSVAVYKLVNRQSETMFSTSGISNSTVVPTSDTGNLKIKAAIVFRLGDVKPVARTEFLLLNKDLENILSESSFVNHLPEDAKAAVDAIERDKKGKRVELFATLLKISDGGGGSTEKLKKLDIALVFALVDIKSNTQHRATTDFQGDAQFTDVKPGNYYVFGYNTFGKTMNVWNVRVDVKQGNNEVILDNQNAVTQ